MLDAMRLWFPGCERTADGRAYICRECGKEYSVELPLRRMRRLAGPERLSVAYFTAINATSTSTSRGRRATCIVARPGGMLSLK